MSSSPGRQHGTDQPVQAAPDERPVFIAGLPRSGTTLMRAILGSHPELAMFPREVPLWRTFYPRYRRRNLTVDSERAELVRRILTHPHVGEAAPDLDAAAIERDLAERGESGCGAVFAAFMRHYASRLGRPRWGVKQPRDEFLLERIWSEFPAARVLELVRDPRDLAVSQHSRRNMILHVDYLIFSWRGSVEIAMRNRARRPDRFAAVRYEDLVSAPEEIVPRLCEFVGLDFRPEMLAMRGQSQWRGHNSSFADVAGESGAISRRAVGRHAALLSPAETWFIQRRLGGLMREWGYAPRPVALTWRDRARILRFALVEPFWWLVYRLDLRDRLRTLIRYWHRGWDKLLARDRTAASAVRATREAGPSPPVSGT